jgi:hypothetical protein
MMFGSTTGAGTVGRGALYKSSVISAQVAQSVEHVLGKDEVGGSIPLLGLLRTYAPGLASLKRFIGNSIGGRDE